MVVTINTDASFSFKHKVGTYAYWVTCDNFKIKKSGLLRKNVDRSEIAEFQCIINALHDALHAERKKTIEKVIVNTDCLNVIHLVKDQKDKVKQYRLQWGYGLVAKYRALLKRHDILEMQMDFRHVKSHQHTDTPKHYINQWCDDAAKFEMSKILASLTNKV